MFDDLRFIEQFAAARGFALTYDGKAIDKLDLDGAGPVIGRMLECQQRRYTASASNQHAGERSTGELPAESSVNI